MLERLRQSLCVVVDAGRISVVLKQGWFKPTASLLCSETWAGQSRPGDGLSNVLGALLVGTGLHRLPTRVVLSDGLVRTWRVEPPRNGTRVQDCHASVAMRFQTVFDESSDEWLLSSDPDANHAFMAWAVRRSLVNEISQAFRTHQLLLLCIEPEFIVLWNHWHRQLPGNAWFAVCTLDSLVLGVVQGGRLTGVRRLPFDASAHQDAVWLRQAVRREADRLDFPVPAALGVCGSVPNRWLASSAEAPTLTVLGTHSNALSLLGVTA